ncbi:MAG TPA: PIN domain-containing protein [Candidatus Micrarchaeia archaeon]|nr:PIN domain-containing protein [Candidatus Micrarchaeia archaeon]
MSVKFFLDTNVFVYEDSPSHPAKQAIAMRLIEGAFASGNGVVSFQVVQEFFSVAFRRFHPPMSYTEAERKLAITFAPLRMVHSSYSLYQHALVLTRKYSLSWYDSLIVAAALEGDCRILYTEDLQHGQKFDRLRVQNPFL